MFFSTTSNPPPPLTTVILSLITLTTLLSLSSTSALDDSLTYIWPLPSTFTSGNDTLTVDPDLSLSFSGNSDIIPDAFLRYKRIIFKHVSKFTGKLRFLQSPVFDLSVVQITVHYPTAELQLGVDESYTLVVDRRDDKSIGGAATIEANTLYGALRALEIHPDIICL